MKHAASRALYAYWDERRGTRAAPERAEIEPGAIRHVLSDTFIVALDGEAGYPFRLAGTRICALFGRELKAEPFIGLWAAASQPIVADLIAVAAGERVGTVAGASATNSAGEPIELELLLLPLAVPRPSLARAIGILAPLQAPHWLGARAIGALTLGSRRHVGSGLQSRLLPRFMAPLAPRSRHGLVVHDGGRS